VSECSFSCGTAKYYTVECSGLLIVQRQDWLGRSFIGFARDLGEAMALIRRDARAGRVIAA